MELTTQEKQVIVNLLNQLSIPVKDVRIVITIIDKLEESIKEDTSK